MKNKCFYCGIEAEKINVFGVDSCADCAAEIFKPISKSENDVLWTTHGWPKAVFKCSPST